MKAKIVVITRDEEEEEMIANILRDGGWDVLPATPQKFVTAPRLEDVGLVLMDHRLEHPGTGLQISHHLREFGFQAPIVIMAGSSSRLDLESFPINTDFLEKPFPIEELLQKVRQKLAQ